MEFAILGPVAARRDGGAVPLARRQPRVLLAVLLAHANQAVSTDRLIAAVWGDHPPRTAAKNLQVNVWHLRRRLEGEDRITFGAAGYTLRVEPEELDAHRFERLAADGRRARGLGEPERAAELLRTAEALWRGDPFAGDDDVYELQVAAGRLVQLRRTVLEERLAADLLTRPLDEVIAELRAATAVHPLWESLWALLITALNRAGHRAEALEEYRVARQHFVDELGLEPGPHLRDLQLQILRGEAEPAAPIAAAPAQRAASGGPSAGGPSAGGPPAGPPSAPPFQPPADIADFTGRAEHIVLLGEQLTTPERDTPAVCTVTGPGGVGKTTLAVHVAHRVRDRFPDGVLYLNLRGAEVRPVSPGEALGQLLRTIGVAGTAIPDDLDERAALYRDRLADRRVLAVLDNAADEAQVLPLIPNTPTAGVLITSRARLTGLPGTRMVALDVLSDAHSADLLERIVGADRLATEPDAAADLVRLCGGLPLALRIAGSRLASRPHWDLAKLAARLVDERHRLDELSHGQLEVRGSVALSYHSLDLDARCLLRRLAMLDAADVAAWTGAALLDVGPAEAEDVIERLVDTHLVDVHGRDPTGATRYRMHDLVRVFARERAAKEDQPQEWRAALARAAGAWLFLAEAGNIRVWGGDYAVIHGPAPRWAVPDEEADRLLGAPLMWFLTERAGILATVRQAAEADLVEVGWDLAVTATILYQTCSLYDDWRESHESALAACRRAGDRRGEGIVLTKLGWLYAHQHRAERARGMLDPARELFENIGEAHGAALAEHALAYVEHLHGRHETALHRHRTAADALVAAGDKGAAAAALRTVGQILLERNEFEPARRELNRALAVIEGTAGAVFRGLVLAQFSELYLLTGQLAEAERDLQTVLDITRRHADIRGQAFCLHRLGRIRRRQGKLAEARDVFVQALAFSRQVSDRIIEAQVLLDSGRLWRDGGHLAEAVATLREAARTAEAVPVPLWQAAALQELGDVLRRQGDETGAREALAVREELGRRYELPALGDVIGAAVIGAAADGAAAEGASVNGAGVDGAAVDGAARSEGAGAAREAPPVTTSG